MIWKSFDLTRVVLLSVQAQGRSLDSAVLKKELESRLNGMDVVAIRLDAWDSSVQTGVHDVSESAALDNASTAALGPHDRDGNSKPAIVAPNPRQADTGLVWGDARPEEEVTIEKVDGSKKWAAFLNGFVHLSEMPAGDHLLLLNYYRPGRDGYAYEQELRAHIDAGHMYIVAFDVDDKPYIEDLGVDASCEIRRTTKFEMRGSANSWLACTRYAARAISGGGFNNEVQHPK